MKLLTIAAKDLRLFFRDRVALFWAFAMPLMFITVFGLAFGDPHREFEVAVVQQDNTRSAELYVAALDNVFNVKMVDSIELAEDKVRDGEVVAAVIIPPGFGEGTARIRLVYDETKGEAALAVVRTVEGVTQVFLGQEPPIDSQPIRGKEYDIFQFVVPGMGIMFVLFNGGIGGASRIVRERDLGTFKRNLLAPIGRASFVGGILLIGLLISCMQLAVFFGWGFLYLVWAFRVACFS